MAKRLAASIVAGLCIGAVAWVDPLFVPLVLAGPIVSGAVGGLRGVALRWLAVTWAVAGASMVVSDWIAHHEDRLFHAVLTGVMVVLVSAGWLAGTRVERRRAARLASEH